MIVDDHPAVREGLARLLQTEGFRVVGQAGTAAAAFELISRRRPRVAIIDLRLGEESGAELSERLAREVPSVAILLYTGELLGIAMVEQLLAGGADGIALKQGDWHNLVGAIEQVAGGRRYVDPDLRGRGPAAADPVATLSERERQILELVGQGLTSARIAEALTLSPHTVRTHIRNILRKLGVSTRAQAVLALERTPRRFDGRPPGG